ncbi:hypothetical protein MMC10_009007 [Thelotrema lepadinum]|nr:hypothetical protein [Thelotrema lepadinum]
MSQVEEGRMEDPDCTGMEGLSIYVAPQNLARVTTEDVDATSGCNSSYGSSNPQAGGTRIEGQGSLTFILSPGGLSAERFSPGYNAHRSLYKIKLPLTNTVFKNGRESTMSRQFWSVYANADGSIGTERQRETPVTQASVCIPLIHHRTEVKPDFRDWSCLTPPRAVSKSAGNIIRSFSKSTFGSHQSSLEDIGASEELEAALSQRFSTAGHAPLEAYEVWAHVTFRKRPPQLPRANTRLNDSIDAGDRFFKVLSGGGGWGSKKGLIALDPDAPFGLESRLSFSRDEDKPFSDLVCPGDVVSFVIIQTPQAQEPKFMRTLKVDPKTGVTPRWLRIRGYQSLRFGRASLHQSSDNRSGRPPIPRHESKAMEALGHFGALSEQGGSVSVDLIADRDSDRIGAEVIGNAVQTNLPPRVDLSYCISSMRNFGLKNYRLLNWRSRFIPNAQALRGQNQMPGAQALATAGSETSVGQTTGLEAKGEEQETTEVGDNDEMDGYEEELNDERNER